MAPRAFWTGHLRLSLVNIPVKLYPATTAERAIATVRAGRRGHDAYDTIRAVVRAAFG